MNPLPHPHPHPRPRPRPHPISSRTHRCSSRTCFLTYIYLVLISDSVPLAANVLDEYTSSTSHPSAGTSFFDSLMGKDAETSRRDKIKRLSGQVCSSTVILDAIITGRESDCKGHYSKPETDRIQFMLCLVAIILVAIIITISRLPNVLVCKIRALTERQGRTPISRQTWNGGKLIGKLISLECLSKLLRKKWNITRK